MYAKDLAREVGTTTDAIVERCRQLDVDLAWSGASLPEEDLDRLRASLAADPPIKVGEPTPSPQPPVPNAGTIPGYQPVRAPQTYAQPYAQPAAPGFAARPQQFAPPVRHAAPPPQRVGCMACGQAPAVRVTFEYGIGMIVMHQTYKRTGVWCRKCGSKAFWSYQGKTLILGWWGLLSLIVYNWIHIFANISAWGTLRKLPKSS